MSLGENINRLRTEKHMSQGELAEALEVSRQSISKWETDGATPELEKLIRLSQLFGVTLDELVTGRASEERESPAVDRTEPQGGAAEERGRPGHRTAAIVLLCMAFATVLLCTLMGGLLEGLVLCLPFLACGLICLTAKEHPGLWCLWALFLMADLYLRYATGLSWAQVRFTILWEPSWNYTRLVTAWCQFLCGLGLLAGTVVRLRRGTMEWTGRNRGLFVGGAALFAVLCLPFGSWIFQAFGLPVSGLVTFLGWFQDGLRLALLSALGTMLVRGRKR